MQFDSQILIRTEPVSSFMYAYLTVSELDSIIDSNSYEFSSRKYLNTIAMSSTYFKDIILVFSESDFVSIEPLTGNYEYDPEYFAKTDKPLLYYVRAIECLTNYNENEYIKILKTIERIRNEVN